MADLDPTLRTRLQSLVDEHGVLLFMKGDRRQPRCGFSAKVVGALDALGADYHTVDVLDDDDVRQGMKIFADWPTFPQLWVDGQLVGGADIVMQLADGGDLVQTLGLPAMAPPAITVQPAARDHILAALQEGEAPRLRLEVSPSFAYRFAEADPVSPTDVEVDVGGLTVVFSRGSAERARGLTLGLTDTAEGPRLVIDNPNEPKPVQQLSVRDYHRWREDDRPHRLIDVRTEHEWDTARIDGAEFLDQALLDALEAAPRDTTLVFQCHHGVRSQQAAEHFRQLGFTDVHNLSGGIDAWSIQVDPSVPRY